MDVPNLQSLSVFLTERLTLAAQEIFKAVEVTVTEYHDEMSRSRQENELLKTRLLEAGIEFYSELQPSVSAFHEGNTSLGKQLRAEQWGGCRHPGGDVQEGGDIQVKLELSASKNEATASQHQTAAAKEQSSPNPWQDNEVRVEDAFHSLMTESDVSTLLHVPPFVGEVKEEPDESSSDLRTVGTSVSQACPAASNHACGLGDDLESHRLTSVHKALRSKMPLSSKEKSARYRERIKNDPATREAYLAKRKESYQRRKREGKIVKPSISQLSIKDKEKVRQRWKQDQRRHRERKRAMKGIWNFTPESVNATLIDLPEGVQLIPTEKERT